MYEYVACDTAVLVLGNSDVRTPAWGSHL